MSLLLKIVNPWWWFKLVVIKPLMLLLSAIFWLPSTLVRLVWDFVVFLFMKAWDKIPGWMKPKSKLGKAIVYPLLAWTAFPGTNMMLFAYLLNEFFGITPEQLWNSAVMGWNVATAMVSAALTVGKLLV